MTARFRNRSGRDRAEVGMASPPQDSSSGIDSSRRGSGPSTCADRTAGPCFSACWAR